MPEVTFVDDTESPFASPGTGVFTAPDDIEDGDILVLFFAIGAVGTPSTPTFPDGFEAPTVTSGSLPISVDSGFSIDAYVVTKVADGESGDYTVTYSTTPTGTGVEGYIVALRGVDPDTPFEFCTTNSGTNSTTGGAGGSSTATGGTAANAGDGILLLSFDFNDSDGALTLPGSTPTFTVEVTPPASSNFTVGFGAMTAGGATGNVVFVNNSSAGDPWGVVMLGLNVLSEATQTIEPTSDITTTGWTPSTGSTLWGVVGDDSDTDWAAATLA